MVLNTLLVVAIQLWNRKKKLYNIILNIVTFTFKQTDQR